MPYQPRATLENPYGPEITFRTEDVLPPSAYYVNPDDSVAAFVATDIAGLLVNLQVRLLTATGEVKLVPYQFTQTQTYNFGLAFLMPPMEGYVLGALCWSENAPRGQCYVSVMIMRGRPTTLINTGLVLLQGYTNQVGLLSYPNGSLESTLSGRGAFITVTAPNSTGTGFSFAVPPLTLWRFCSLSFTLATTAAPGNRQPYVSLLDQFGLQVGVWGCSIAQAPGGTSFYCFSPGGIDKNAGSIVNFGGPGEIFLPRQGTLNVNCLGLAAGDQFTSIAALFEEWLGF